MSDRKVKIISTMIICLILILTATVVNAAADISDFKPKETDASDKIAGGTGVVITVVQTIGIGIAIVMLIALAIKYISAAPSDKADIKKSAIVYIIGAILLFAASGILQIFKTAGDDINETISGETTDGEVILEKPMKQDIIKA